MGHNEQLCAEHLDLNCNHTSQSSTLLSEDQPHLLAQLLAQVLVLAIHQLLAHVRVQALRQRALAAHVQGYLVKFLVLLWNNDQKGII